MYASPAKHAVRSRMAEGVSPRPEIKHIRACSESHNLRQLLTANVRIGSPTTGMCGMGNPYFCASGTDQVKRQIHKLSVPKVNAIKERGMHADGDGLYLQVGKSGTKSWIYRFREHGRLRDMGLGSLTDVSLAQARRRPNDCRTQRRAGSDPIEAARAERAAKHAADTELVTFDEARNAYIEAHRAGWRNAKHADQWVNTLTTYATPILGSLPVRVIDVAHVMKVLDPIWRVKPETASRVRGRIEAILDWARARGYRQGENPARWRGHLSHQLPRRSKVRRVKHHPALPYAEMGTFMAKLREQEGTTARGLEFIILTVARSAEAREATWSELSQDAAIWTVPPDRIKAGREHRVPLSRLAQAIIKHMRALARGEFVFPGLNRSRPVSATSMDKLLKRLGYGHVTVHGFRSTFRDWAAETTNFPERSGGDGSCSRHLR